MGNIARILLSIFLILCLIDWSYGYYEFVRFATTGCFLYFAVVRYKMINEVDNRIFLYLLIALLFQPFWKVALGRTIWNIVDVIIALFLIWEVYQINKKK